MMRIVIFVCVVLSSLSFSGIVSAKEVSADITEGAYLFRKFCSLCHGINGMGEGPLALTMQDYPDTNLLTSNSSLSREETLKVITLGSQMDKIGAYMPPWRSAFSDQELNQLTDFVIFLRKDPAKATVVLRNQSNRIEPNVRHGQLLYNTYCTRCHGKEGKGDGKMSRIVKTPPPFDLTKSVQNDTYLMLIITGGGEPMKRSAQMPPWGDELSPQDIQSVIKYIKTFRQ